MVKNTRLGHSVGLGVLVISVLMALVGCTSTAPSPSPTNERAKIFQGTPAEWSLLFRSCLEDNGLTTADLLDGDASGFMLSNDGVTEERRTEVTTKCRSEIGEPQMEGLSNDELHRRYESRLDQFQCLLKNDLISGSPMSFEKFVDEYNRSGQKQLWSPDQDASTVERDGILYGPTDICPRDTSTW